MDAEFKTEREICWLWMTKSDFKPEMETLICDAQEQTLRINSIEDRIEITS